MRLQRWRWSVHTATLDVAGEINAATAADALAAIARDQGCSRDPADGCAWHHGGHATCRNSAGEETTIVVVAFGPAILPVRTRRPIPDPSSEPR